MEVFFISNSIIAAGHTPSGNILCESATDIDESLCTREISQLVAKALKERGNEEDIRKIFKKIVYNIIKYIKFPQPEWENIFLKCISKEKGF
ncbi:MAG: hypothetical protein ACI398_01960 [Clostridium sp.]